LINRLLSKTLQFQTLCTLYPNAPYISSIDPKVSLLGILPPKRDTSAIVLPTANSLFIDVTFYEDLPFYPSHASREVTNDPFLFVFPLDPTLPVCSQEGASSASPHDNTLAERIEPIASNSHASNSSLDSKHEITGSSPHFPPQTAIDEPLFVYSPLEAKWWRLLRFCLSLALET